MLGGPLRLGQGRWTVLQEPGSTSLKQPHTTISAASGSDVRALYASPQGPRLLTAPTLCPPRPLA